MKVNQVLHQEILATIENQIRDNDPPETSLTYQRLTKLGFSDLESKKLIGQCLIVEIFDIMKSGKPFNKERYILNLDKLPEEPFN